MAEPITLLPAFDGATLAQVRQIARETLDVYITAAVDVTPTTRQERAAEMVLHDRMLGLHLQIANLPDGADDLLAALVDCVAEVGGLLESLDRPSESAEAALTLHCLAVRRRAR